MYENYERRVKDFVIDMTNPDSIIERKDVTEKITNTREEIMNELFAKYPEKKKPLVFRGYINEHDRIKDTIKNNKYLYYLPDYEKIKQERKKIKNLSSSSSPIKNNLNYKKISNIMKHSSLDKKDIKEKRKIINENIKISSQKNLDEKHLVNKIQDNTNEKLISQPTMRYKPRTDLERVYDALNTYNFNTVEKSRDIIERQLKSINLYDYKRPGDSNNNEDKTGKENYIKNYKNRSNLVSKSVRNGKRKKPFDLYKKSTLYYNPKNYEYKPWQRKEDLNNEAYNLLSPYHYKTHFKAAEEIAESNYKYDKNNYSVFLLPNLLPNYYTKKPLHTDLNNKEEEDPFKFGEDDNSSEPSEDYEELDKNYNPIIQKSKKISDPETMKILSKIAFKKKKTDYDNFDYRNGEDDEKNIRKLKKEKGSKNYAENNNVIIGDKLYFKNTQFDKITSKILDMCNVYSNKSKFNNTVHKSKGGKTMITQGMTVGEFEKKYGLKE